jgi:hypothetical protein
MADKRSYQARQPQDYRVLLQDTGDPLTRIFGPLTREQLIETSVGPIREYAIDAYCHCVNHAGGVYHDSKVREKVAEHIRSLQSGTIVQMKRAIQQLIAKGNDPLAVYAEGAHQAGMDYFLRVRMNDLHDRVGSQMSLGKALGSVAEPYYYPSKFKLDHPEYLLGDPDGVSNTENKAFWEAGALNYALGQVRDYTVKLVKELVEKYDLDGLELDFIRHPFLFASGQAYAQRHVMTSVIRRIREITKDAAKTRGRAIYLSARVMDSIEMNQMIGLDVNTWLKEGLLDLITIGGGYCPFGTPWWDITSLAQRYGVPALGTMNMIRKLGREAIRAAAERMFAHGVQGVLLWNFFYEMEYYHEPGRAHLGFEFTRELTNPDALKTLPKTYHLAQSLKGSSGFVPPSQIGNRAVFDIGDAPGPGRITLSLEILNLAPGDELLFFWNDKPIHSKPDAWVGNIAHDRHRLEFDLSPEMVCKGENRLEMRLTKRCPDLVPYVTLLEGKLRMEPV